MTSSTPLGELSSRSLPALITLAFDRLAADLVARTHALGFEDLQLSHYLTVLRFVSVDGVRAADIARQAGVTQQAISLTVADLEAKGYVERVPDPSDRRARLVRWSDRGREAAVAMEEWFGELERGWRDQVGGVAVDGAHLTLAVVAAGRADR